MGDANKRGPREVRVAQAIKRNEEEAERRRLAELEAEARLTPEQRRRRNRAGLVLATALGIAGGPR